MGRAAHEHGTVTEVKPYTNGYGFDVYEWNAEKGRVMQRPVRRKTKDLAMREHSRLKLAFANAMNPRDSKITVQDLFARWMDRPMPKSSHSRYPSVYRCHIAPTWGGVRIGDIRRAQVSDWYKALVYKLQDQGRSNGTINKVFDTFSSMLGWAVENQWLTINPCKGVRRVEALKRTIGAEALTELTEIAEHFPARYALMPWLAMMTGTRPGELRALRIEDVDRERLTVTIAHHLEAGGHGIEPVFALPKASWRKANHGARVIDVPVRLIEMFDEHVVYTGSPHGLIFTTEDGWPVSVQKMTKMMREARAAANVLKPYTCHSWRHFFTSLSHQNGASLAELQAMLGHASVATTRVYLHAITDRPVSADRNGAVLPGRSEPEPNVVHVAFGRQPQAPSRSTRPTGQGRAVGT